MNPFSVSVVIPAYNAAQSIESAILSVLGQTRLPLEILVVDDGSVDETQKIVSTLARSHSSVRLLQNMRNLGVSASRNHGFREAQGSWIAILDADDRFTPGRLEYLVGRAEELQLDLAADNFQRYDAIAGVIVKIAIPPETLTPHLLLDRYSFVSHCMTGSDGATDFGLLKPLFRTKFLREAGLTYRETIYHGEDFVFYLEALLQGARFGVFPEAGYLYTERVGSLSRKSSGLSKTEADFQAVERQSRDLAASGLGRQDPELAQLLLHRANRLDTTRRFIHLRSLIKEGRFLPAAKQLLLEKDVRESAFQAFRSRWRRRS